MKELKKLSELFGKMSIEERSQWGLTQANIALGVDIDCYTRNGLC